MTIMGRNKFLVVDYSNSSKYQGVDSVVAGTGTCYLHNELTVPEH